MTFRFVDAQNAAYPVTILCRMLEVSRGGYYAWRKGAAQCASTERLGAPGGAKKGACRWPQRVRKPTADDRREGGWHRGVGTYLEDGSWTVEKMQ